MGGVGRKTHDFDCVTATRERDGTALLVKDMTSAQLQALLVTAGKAAGDRAALAFIVYSIVIGLIAGLFWIIATSH